MTRPFVSNARESLEIGRHLATLSPIAQKEQQRFYVKQILHLKSLRQNPPHLIMGEDSILPLYRSLRLYRAFSQAVLFLNRLHRSQVSRYKLKDRSLSM